MCDFPTSLARDQKNSRADWPDPRPPVELPDAMMIPQAQRPRVPRHLERFGEPNMIIIRKAMPIVVLLPFWIIHDIRRVKIEEYSASLCIFYAFIHKARPIVAGNPDIAATESVCDCQDILSDAVDLPPLSDLLSNILLAAASLAPIPRMTGLMQSEFHKPDTNNLGWIVRAVCQCIKFGVERVERIGVRLECFD